MSLCGSKSHWYRRRLPVFRSSSAWARAADSVASRCRSRWLDANNSRVPSVENQLQVVRPRPVLIRTGVAGRGAAMSKGCTKI